jgi:hypothetical protein
MVYRKNFFEIDPEKETHKYRIFKELEANGKSIVENVNEKEWWESVARSIGADAQKVKIDNNFVVLPPLTSRTQRMGIIATGNGVRIEEKKFPSISRFIPVKNNKP